MTERDDAVDEGFTDSGDRPRPRPRPGPGVAPSQSATRSPVHPAEDVPVELLDPDDLPAPRRRPGPGRHRAAAEEQPEEVPAARERVARILNTPPSVPTAAVDAETADPSEKPATQRSSWARRRSVLVRTAIVLAVAAVVAVLLRAYVVEPYYIPSESMEPTLRGCTGCTDDHVLVDKISYRFQSVHAGDIVVFHKPKNADVADDVLIKRVIAVAGQKVQLRKGSDGQYDGKVYVNGLRLDEGYVNKACGSRATVPLTNVTSWTIPKGEVFVMGDNRCHSEDSRAFGPIKTSSVIGRAVLIIWPLNRFGGI